MDPASEAGAPPETLMGKLVRRSAASSTGTFYEWLCLPLRDQSADFELFLTCEARAGQQGWLMPVEYLRIVPSGAESVEVQLFLCDLRVILALAKARRSSDGDAVASSWRIAELLRAALDHGGDVRLKLALLSRRLRMSERHLGRLFRSVAGMSFRQFLKLVRMAKAAESLRMGAKTVEEIATDAGHSGASNFIREFRCVFGVTPVEFRNLFVERNPGGSGVDSTF